MADRELKRLSRRELLEMLIAQGRENERLQAEIALLKDQLSEREIRLEKSGSIAEAALRLNGIFEAAQRAAEQYLENISRGEITKAMIGEADDFVIIDARGNVLLPNGEIEAAPEPEQPAEDGAVTVEQPGKKQKKKKKAGPSATAKNAKTVRAAKKPKEPKESKERGKFRCPAFLRKLPAVLKALPAKLKELPARLPLRKKK